MEIYPSPSWLSIKKKQLSWRIFNWSRMSSAILVASTVSHNSKRGNHASGQVFRFTLQKAGCKCCPIIHLKVCNSYHCILWSVCIYQKIFMISIFKGDAAVHPWCAETLKIAWWVHPWDPLVVEVFWQGSSQSVLWSKTSFHEVESFLRQWRVVRSQKSRRHCW